MALFAPGWVYEGEGNRSNWRVLNEQLWSSLADVMGPPHALITKLPFVTTFGTGSGTAVHHLVRIFTMILLLAPLFHSCEFSSCDATSGPY